jgi:chromosome segregation ATPase
MTPQAMFWTLTSLGALLFFLLGYVGRALRAGPAPVIAERADDGKADEITNKLRQERDRIAAENEELRRQWKEETASQAEAFAARQKELEAKLAQRPSGDAHDGEIAKLKAEVDEHKAARAQAEEALRREQRDRDKVLAEVQKLRDAQVRAHEDATAVNQLRAAVAKLEAEKTALAKRPMESQRPPDDSAKKELEKLRVEHRRTKADADRYKAEADKARAEGEKLRAELAKDETELGKLRAEAQKSGADAERRKGEWEKLSAEADEARAERDALRAEVAAVRDAASTEQARAAQVALDAAGRLEELQFEVEQYSVRFEAAQAHALRAQRKLDQALAQAVDPGPMDALRSQLEQAEGRLSAFKRRAEAIEQERDEARDRLKQFEEARLELDQLVELKEETRSLRQKLQAAEARSAEADRTRDENRALRDRVTELVSTEHAGRELERLGAEHKQARLEAELLRRKVEELQGYQVEVSEARHTIQSMHEQAAQAEVLRERVRLLEARLFAVGLPDSDREPVSQAAGRERSIDTAPASLMSRSGARTAVLSDRAGLLVAGAGDPELQESLAAVSGLLFQATEQISTLVPVSRVSTVRVLDDNDVVIACGMLWVGDEPFALSAMGPRSLSEEDLAKAMVLASDSIRAQLAAP